MQLAKRRLTITAALLCSIGIAGAASATVVTMNFDDMPNATYGEYVNNFYGGGCGASYEGGPVDCNGPNYGITWNGAIAGGAPDGIFDNASNEPSMQNIMALLSNTPAYMNVASGFTTGFSLYYAAAYDPAYVDVFSGFNGSGTELASFNLPANGANCDWSPEDFSCWTPIGITFDGMAESVAFGDADNSAGFDNITLGSSTPTNGVPEPSELGTFGLGLMLLGGCVGLRRRGTA